MLFNKAADGLEKSTDAENEYMIIDNDPLINRFISIPKDMSQLSCAAFCAGIIEAVLDGALFQATVTAHTVAMDNYPTRTVYLIKLDSSVLQREKTRFAK
ncbi:hypothetical protein NADFUDRAFT_81000 [Nadsonia fulvescens var. elongata DSM 6958]|uniref:Uncharacterized protein n=1 Tax=Nadsonia fulvescens var. elongata DSM 6958 TaxID=857566 RepID=A0A1E3PRI4_9ASCO|nr:hypothetical protein NADFUDRAFT_81000 [Nadsonia fulvescens var. elongata DSM 6958]